MNNGYTASGYRSPCRETTRPKRNTAGKAVRFAVSVLLAVYEAFANIKVAAYTSGICLLLIIGFAGGMQAGLLSVPAGVICCVVLAYIVYRVAVHYRRYSGD